ncbi:MAG: DUF1800 domain-containing protein [Phaeodactylibacter sp.]|nr:DUF1800 domain-containing protein [Phaeodactylibacter sp.]MCB9265685.1 DUF1800 domain-containing protein [Lewinellaceae bacterium]MCB9288389.1 DUF1800 domain-containing protein [Lewinellaceae bacterium]
MDRRATIATLLGRGPATAATAAAPLVNSGLEPYTGPWEYEQAAHLLRRALFGPTYVQIREAAGQGLGPTLEQLFTPLPLPEPPLNHFFQEDPQVPVGQTWVDAPYYENVNVRGYRRQSLRAWTMELLYSEGASIREKLTLFWHNHFAVREINDAKFLYKHISLLRKYAWGNFRELVKAVTIDPAMLRFLNGNQNTRTAPNENFARELLELFTIGKGPLAGPGDYTNYTEDDIREIARVLTGWRDVGFFSTNPGISVGAIFRPFQHDSGQKQLSHRFNNILIEDMGDQEYAHLIDVIFQQDEAARFICRKLYRWFVYYVIDDNAEENVIAPMAQLLVDNDYEIQPALEALLGSAHFFDMLNVGPMIKNPLDFVMSSIKPFGVEFPQPLRPRYNGFLALFNSTVLQQMEYYNPPQVAGWKAYYQEPQYYRTWINATTLPIRMLVTDTMALNGFPAGDFRVRIDPLAFVETIDNPNDPNALIEEFVQILFPQPITDDQKAALKEVLIPGLPDFEWTVEYNLYLANPDDEELAEAVATKLRQLIQAMLSMPEFYLS